MAAKVAGSRRALFDALALLIVMPGLHLDRLTTGRKAGYAKLDAMLADGARFRPPLQPWRLCLA